jgi:hypothetical protein
VTARVEQLAHARRVADAILYEGYLLYPYRQSAQKNQARFQFGVLMPPAYADLDPNERSASQTECLVECASDAAGEVTVLARFLQLQHRRVERFLPDPGEWQPVPSLELAGAEYTTWEEAAEREERVTALLADLLQGRALTSRLQIEASETTEELIDADGRVAGRLIRHTDAIAGAITVTAERTTGPYGAIRLRVRVENHSAPPAGLRTRDDGLAVALIAAHVLIDVPGGIFLSMTDPPEWAARDIAACQNIGTWPVLAGPAGCRELMLSSPVILYDHPEVAAESAGDMFDATEIDEILTLRTLALTDSEKREARATDARAAELMDRLDHLPPEMLERLHGVIRYLGPARSAASTGSAAEPGGDRLEGRLADLEGGLARPDVPWWDPGADTTVSPATDHITVRGVRVASGARVRMRPGSRRADAQDLFLAGREAIVQAVLHDVDGNVHVAVTPADDPAADLQSSHGRFLYFAPDEIEPIGAHGWSGPDGAASEDPACPVHAQKKGTST